MDKKVVTFGEIMLRLSPPNYQRLIQADSFDVTYGGGEANVSVSLASFGLNSYYVTKLPINPLGDAALNNLRRFGVKTDYIVRGGDRLGIYFLEIGAAQRPSKVVYDRAHSAIAVAKVGDFDWDEIFKDTKWFHFTGITPALSDTAADLTLEAVKKAKQNNLKVSCDLNYRRKLWSTEKANKVMTSLMDYVDIVLGNEEDAEKIFGIKAPESDISTGQLNKEGYKLVAQELIRRFKLELVAITLRKSYSASDNGWSALAYDGKNFYNSTKYQIHIIDRVGGGDAFAGGLIYSLINGNQLQEALDFAVAASCLKHAIPGDFNLVSKDEVKSLQKGNVSGRVQR
ncbi:2-dehydro-3-deoxygluconokinase [Candidatus Atribacteria bacterium HGW-Atribacteria-1]|nr:MAG: 2-dehydro-3-deoxygluconokinase [Candidatus Atribacteria bacterium HGW-Atribacteria-1]